MIFLHEQILESQAKVVEKKGLCRPYNVLPYDPDNQNYDQIQAMMQYPEIGINLAFLFQICPVLLFNISVSINSPRTGTILTDSSITLKGDLAWFQVMFGFQLQFFFHRKIS